MNNSDFESKNQLKDFYQLIDNLDKELDEAEGGTHCVFFTLIIRIKSLEKAFYKNPNAVRELLTKNRFLLAEDGTISTNDMGNAFDEMVDFLEKNLGLHPNCDLFLLDGSLELWDDEEEVAEKFDEFFPRTSQYFDLIKVLRGHIVIRLKENIDEIVQKISKTEAFRKEKKLAAQRKNDLLALAENKKYNMKKVIEKAKRRDTIYMKELVDFVHYENMVVCSNCGGIYGGWRYEPEIKDIIPGQKIRGYFQLCSCKRNKNQEKWPGFDFNEVLTLCHGCGRELLMSGSKWSVWFCDQCKEKVLQFNTLFQRTIIPIGRHSMMHGYQLKGQDTQDQEKIHTFVENTNKLHNSIDRLYEWKKLLVKEVFKTLGISHDIFLVDYIIQTKKELKKDNLFYEMCSFFLNTK